ncbi:capsule polysaccharide transporter [Kordiimonas sediminis]|uniref:Capsule polysaccharide transporter n=2 Tax=Kordiimonas sediminis TaxID=1735581 RepID=A0A919AQF6_9PROT|nr:capsule polysaccharide transporter [Kordiimonas sediminis]
MGMLSSLGGYRYVVFTVLLAALYYGVYASDRYATVTQIYVKQVRGGAMPVSALTSLMGASSERQDALLVQQYILSKDMLAHLDAKIGLKQHFSAKDWDIVSRLDDDATDEDFLEYFHSRLKLTLDPESSILTVEGQAFTPEYSKMLIEEIVSESETFINRISQQIAEQETEFVTRELTRSKDALHAAQQDILKFQNTYSLLDPEQTSAAVQTVVNELDAELVRLRAEEKTLLSYMNPEASDVVVVRDRIDAVERQLSEERKRMTDVMDDQALSDLNAMYREKELSLQFATDLYQTTLAGYEQARVESFRKIKHLVVVEKPVTADEALYPRKLYNLATLLVILSLIYGIMVMTIATIREHRDA